MQNLSDNATERLPDHTDASNLSTWQWLVQGIRAGVFLSPRIANVQPTPLQVLLLFSGMATFSLGVDRLAIPGPAVFNLQAWLATWWVTLGTLWLAWWAFWPGRTPLFCTWLALSTGSALPALLMSGVISALHAGQVYPAALVTGVGSWLVYIVFLTWFLLVGGWLLARFAAKLSRIAVFVVAGLALALFVDWQFPERPWSPAYRETDGANEPPRLSLSQEIFETQQVVWQEAVDALDTSRHGEGDPQFYGLVFAPYASENVFLRESTMVSQVLADRFDAHRRVLHLVNHATTVATHPWATTLNLQRGIEALAQRMDKQRDVLVVYLTSHGGGDFKLASSHWPLSTQPLTPQQLRTALDDVGIVNRIVIVSACYSGGWVAPLATDTTLVMTAADATHTSYGCGTKSDLTFFGRALFDEQLRKTHSFEQAFAQAVPVIKAREVEARKDDGFSNPQISMGAALAPVLKQLEQRLALEK